MNFKLRAYSLQDIGKRDNQEDCFFPTFIDPCHYDEIQRDWTFYDGASHSDDRLFIVCDGMGGHDRGEFASQIVTKTISDYLLNYAPIEGLFTDDILRKSVAEATDALHAEANPLEKRPMGTTLALLKFHTDGATIGHIGDSRVYHFRPANGEDTAKILFRTEDHTVVNDMVRRGGMTAEEAAISPQRHVLSRCMSSRPDYFPEIDINHITDIQKDDIFLICSDGIYENLTDEELCAVICDQNYKGADLAQHLLSACRDNRDNHTAYIIQIQDVLDNAEKQESHESLQQGTTIRSKNHTYHVEKVLGNGAFGVTYLVTTEVALQGQLGTVRSNVNLALKEFFMHNEMRRTGNEVEMSSNNEQVQLFARKFQDEARKLSMLSHPNILKVLEVFEANGTYYYSMEYLPDGSLFNYVNKRDGLPEDEALRIIRQIGGALSYLHLNKMLHLDIKPANVMLDKENNLVKIIDFGLAKQYEDDGDAVTNAMLGAGTSGYAPLEQSDTTIAHEFSPQLDVYALGATYYKILTSLTPNNAISILNEGLSTAPLVKKRVSEKSIRAIKAAMQPLTANRLKTVAEFLDMLPSVDDADISRPKRSLWKRLCNLFSKSVGS